MNMNSPYLYVFALALLLLLMWRKKAFVLQAILAFFIGVGVGGWLGRLTTGVIGWVSSQTGHIMGRAFGVAVSAGAVAAAIGLFLLVLLVIDLNPKKGKATNVTVAAAFLLPLLWPALKAGLETVSPGITAGIGG